ncbi:MAG: PaaI family thioesterase [Anaerolineae bacterium]|jgi:uncharacterized protein (TIGR00369 family)|nr:PaaI family thioesterase [Chloroflexota bacterium]
MQRQNNSRYCFLCGTENPIGLNLSFYDLEDGRVASRFTPGEEHQGYPGVLHGGIACALLDETIGRTLSRLDLWAMTVELNTRFLKPVPLHAPLTVVGEMVRLRSRMMEGKGEILLEDGTIAVTATARYIRLNQAQTEAFKSELGHWRLADQDPDEDAATRAAIQRMV